MFINRGVMPARSSELVTIAGNFLHHVNVDNDAALFFPTKTEYLRHASFVDGRTPLATGPAEVIPISEASDMMPARAPGGRYIFNMSFCGSTYISRLLDVPSTTLVLKEPKAFTDVAAWKTMRLRGGESLAGLYDPIRLVRHAAFREHEHDEKVVIKPACWANNIIPELLNDDDNAKAIFVTVDRRRFLNAVFRGGADRVEHTARLAWHMATVAPDGEELLAAAVDAADDDERQRQANLVLIAHGLQARVFDGVRRKLGWSSASFIDFGDLVSAPFETALQACKVLNLANDEAAIKGNVVRLAGTHAKQPGQRFSLAQQVEDDRALLAPLEPVFDKASDWAERMFDDEGRATA